MKGRYHFRVRSKKILFDFTLRRNITVIKGDSATGKTTLLHMLYEYLRTGRESGYSVSADAPYLSFAVWKKLPMAIFLPLWTALPLEPWWKAAWNI